MRHLKCFVCKYAILALLKCCCLLSLYGQPSDWVDQNAPGSWVLGVEEIGHDLYCIVGTGQGALDNPKTEFSIALYRCEVPSSGSSGIGMEQIHSITYSEDFFTLAVAFIDETDLWLTIQSKYKQNWEHQYRLILYDQGLNVVSEYSFDTLGYPIVFHMDSYQDKTVVLGSIIGPPEDEILYFKYDHEAPNALSNVIIKKSTPNNMFWITSMEFDEVTGNMLIFYFNGIAELDSNLFQVQNFNHLSHIGTYHHGDVSRIGDSYFSHGITSQGLGNGTRFIILQKYNSDFEIISNDTFGIPGIDNYPFIANSLDNDDNEILIGGHLDGPINNFDVYSNIKKFYLAKYDQDLNRIWYKEYGGDRAYWFAGVKLLKDGSGLAYGFLTDTIDGTRHGYLMYVDENGDILSSTTLPSDPIRTVQVVNPGGELLRILNPSGVTGDFILYDLSGRVLLKEILVKGNFSVPTVHIPPGLYPYSIIEDGQIIDSGKWLKGR